MDSVIIAVPGGYEARLEATLAAIETFSKNGESSWVVDGGMSRVFVSRNEFVATELEPERWEQIASVIPQPVFYTVDFSDIDLCRRVLMLLADDPNLLVDNDHGVVLAGPEFVRLLRGRGDWDWRRDPP
jgi:hypothetical protein